MQSSQRVPQDLVAIFHASFHPTKGSLIDWSLRASDDLDLTNVEFSCLPSGLHLVEEDVVYFSKDSHQGVCVFRRRKTTEHGHRGFRLSSLGILLAKSARPRPWRHVAALKDLVHRIYSVLEDRGVLEPREEDWEPARAFFEQRKVRRVDLAGAGDWNGWSHEFDGPSSDLHSIHPTMHLPHLLRILGPSSLTLYKHIFGRRRILIFTLPPVEASCILCQVAADMCLDSQVDSDVDTEGDRPGRLRGRCREGVKVLGMVTLNDLDKLHQESQTGRGWIACTTDAIFLEKPSYYDLIIDLTTSTPSKATRPTFYVSRPNQPSSSKGPSHRLSPIRFTWSDVKLWNEIDRLLEIDAADRDPIHHHACCAPGSHSGAEGVNSKAPGKLPPAWTDVWRIYEDVCLVCAGLWLGAWRNNSTMSYSTVGQEGSSAPSNWGSVRLEGDDDLTVSGTYVRNVGMGIEGRPASESSEGSAKKPKSMRRNSGMSLATMKDKKRKDASSSTTVPAGADDRDVLTTMALLQTFHANTRFLLSRLAAYVPSSDADAIPSSIVLTPKDILTFELGPLSSLDARFLEWLTEEYGGGVRVSVRKGWRDLVGLVLGLG
ncbi:hypothetical protein GLOTRDRAFT_140044 [Gloeophyllum trabeum ATCC 11539]|uniref:DUF4484 domain-containing protein n=1 Tax=Gloeophyllum trabeum (strain ATCC 11539 / FP-39264 / Madison 617) TaxID=670483 RepID=S7Q097_GLOTA|nr:uncharacterized protein GLOTRDRAFT_140044 [Gloeophyllum trabeum ATCC 11539]EPQ53118.1 hypothetical protein GLOTRDRAFT_140044 [Gloeophyllum trabeum ATCC 11539]